MKRTKFAGIVLFLLAAAGMLNAGAQTVTTDYDHQANFSAYKTYMWGTGTPLPNPLMDQRVVAAVDAQLSAKGFTKVTANPDMMVVYHGSVTEQTQLNTMGYGGWGARWGGGMSTTTVDKIPYGQLVIDIGDAKTKQLLWLGNASNSLNSNPQKNSALIDKAVTKLFKNFPPQPAKK